MLIPQLRARTWFKSAGYALRGWAARLSRGILDNVNTFIVLSEFQRQRFIAQGISPERIEILPNMTPAVADRASVRQCDGASEGGASVPRYDSISVSGGATEAPKHRSTETPKHRNTETPSPTPIAFVGRASPEKGIEDFVEAARRLPDLPFAVAGATERMPWLVTKARPIYAGSGFSRERTLTDFYSESGC